MLQDGFVYKKFIAITQEHGVGTPAALLAQGWFFGRLMERVYGGLEYKSLEVRQKIVNAIKATLPEKDPTGTLTG